MPLRLITGPANAAKAGLLLAAVGRAAQEEPLLVVPTAVDADRYRRELVESGVVLGPQVFVFDGLLREIRRRAGVPREVLGDAARTHLAARAVAGAELVALGPATVSAGFAAAFTRFADELAEQRVSPQRFAQAMRAWAGEDAERQRYASELSGLVRADAALLAKHGLSRAVTRTNDALDVLRQIPALWRGTPIFLYGFDDLSPQQKDVVESLSGPVGAAVTLALTFEAGREVFLSRARLHQDLLSLGAQEESLQADDAHYDAASRTALGHIERSLFDEAADPSLDGTGVHGLCGGGERAEIELAAREIAQRIAAGTPADEIAVVCRGIERRAPLIEEVFGEHGVQVASRFETTADRTTIGRSLLALLACATGSGSADDLYTYLRTPGLTSRLDLVDRTEAEGRRSGIRSAPEALRLWERHGTQHAIVDLRRSVASGFDEMVEELIAAIGGMLAAHGPASAPLLTGEPDAAAAGELIRTLRSLESLPSELQPDADELSRMLTRVKVRVGSRGGPDAVTLAEPQSLRARRVRALYVLDMTTGTFPAAARPEPFLGDDERASINAASGLRLRLHEDASQVEQLFLYAAVSRPTEALIVGWHEATDDGDPVVRSHFVDEIARLLPDDVLSKPVTRRLGEAGWDAAVAPTRRLAQQHEAANGPGAVPAVISPLTESAALDPIRERDTWSASGIETWLSCPVRWFVERHLRPIGLEPDPEALVRGSLAHRVLERVVAELAQTGGGLAATEPEVRQQLVISVLADEAARRPLSVNPERLRAELRRLELDLLAYLEQAATSGSCFQPSEFEFAFGTDESGRPPLELGGGIVRLAGQIDRVDLSAGHDKALIYDYKGRGRPMAHGKWLEEGRLQILLYLLAVRSLLGVRPVGGFYQPLNAEGHRPRGVLVADEDPGLGTVKGDRMTADELEALLTAAADRAAECVDEIRAGVLNPRPETCGVSGGCQYPTICRVEAAAG